MAVRTHQRRKLSRLSPKALTPRARRRGTIGHLLVCAPLQILACGPQVELEDHEADAEVYVRGWCEERHSKWLECIDFVPEDRVPFSVDECVEDEMAEVIDACFAESDEFFRCWAERVPCEEYVTYITARPGSICHDFVVVLGECRARNE